MKNIADAYPLSPTQQGMLFESLYAPGGTGLYVEQITWDLRGELNVSAYRRAWEVIVQRHPVLRTALIWESVERPLQVVRQAVRLVWEELDWRGEPHQSQQAKFDALLVADQRRGFELGRAPLHRFTLVQVADDAFRFLWSFHHVILDGWSEPLILRGLLAAYEAFCRQSDPSMAPSPPYRDYIEWLARQDPAAAETFWREYLKGFGRSTPLPLGTRAAKDDISDPFAEFERTLSADISRAVQHFLRARQITLSTLVQGAWALVLSIYSGHRDVIFGNVVAGRSSGLPNSDAIIGLMVNTLPVRVTIESSQTVADWLKGIQHGESLARVHEHVALVDIQGWSDVPRGAPLFETLLAVENLQSSMPPMLDGLLEICTIQRRSSRASYPLVLGVVPGQLISVGLGYQGKRFDHDSVERLLEQLIFVLDTLIKDGDRRLDELPLISPQEHQQIVIDWNATAIPFQRERGVHVFFDEQAKRTPSSIAVVDGDLNIAFSQLESRSNRIARWLVHEGVRPGDRVGLLIQRSPDLMAAILAVLKAGGCYVPLDIENPPARQAQIITDASISLILTDAAQSEIAAQTTARVIALRGVQSAIDVEPDSPLGIATRLEDIAYVLYTSGSTGTPKGVAISHGGLANHCQAIAACYELTDKDRVLQFASIAFDVAAEELFPSWAIGAAVVLRPPGPVSDIDTFVRFIQQQRLTVLNLPAAYWEEWVRETVRTGVDVPSCVRLVIVGNERVPSSSLRMWRKHVPHVRWLNAYGPTEATITATIYEPDAEVACDTVPIGRPIANVQAYVLDPELRPLPAGAVGQLFLGGSGLASGYVNAAQLTAERFIANPFEARSGTRLYRTGDLARWRLDGNLEFLGRDDAQIKLRGFRIEPGEIESVLCACPDVAEALVTLRDDPHSRKPQLIAYVVPKDYTPIELWPSVGEYPIYDELLYFAMTSDKPRTQAYRAAIDRVVPGKTVVEIGTGGDAILARFCAEAGATRVYAIEMSAEAYESAKRRIAGLGLDDRVIVIHGDSMKVTLPEPVDVCVSEIIGTIGSSEGAAVILNNAWRFLKPGGVMIPQRCVTRIAAVSLPEEAWRGAGFSSVSAGYLERVFRAVGQRFNIRLCLKHIDTGTLISDNAIFEEMGFTGVVPAANTSDIILTIRRPALLTGLLLWIDLATIEGEHVDSFRERTSWLPVYFPLFHPGIPVDAGDTIQAICTSRLSDNELNPDYRLQGTLHRANNTSVRFDHHSLHHGRSVYQNDFYRRWLAEPMPLRNDVKALTPASLRTWLEQHLPSYMVPAHFLLLKELPRTTAGKIDQTALPAPEPPDSDESRHFKEPRGHNETALADIWSRVLNVPRVAADDNFFHLGGDSILALQIVSRARQANLHVNLEQIFRSPVLANLAAMVAPIHSESAPVTTAVGPVPLTPIQRWFVEQNLPDPHHYNLSMMFDVSSELAADVVEAAFRQVILHHPALRMRFTIDDSRWSQSVRDDDGSILFTTIEVGSFEDEIDGALNRRIAERQASLDLRNGSLVHATLFQHASGRSPRLLIVIHHLVVDGVSWRIIFEDLETSCRQLRARQPAMLPEATSSFLNWSTRLHDEAVTPTTHSELEYWVDRSRRPIAPLPRDEADGINSEDCAATLTATLDTNDTRALLHDAHLAYHTKVNDLLLTALTQVLTRWTGSRIALIDLEGHGREPSIENMDVSRTVGWFTSAYPALLELPSVAREGDAIKSIKEQLAAVPHHGIGYGLLRYLGNETTRNILKSRPQAEITFNYFGQIDAGLTADSFLRPLMYSVPAQRSPRQLRSHLIDINAMVRGQYLEVTWTFGRDIHRETTIQSLADQYIAALRSIIAHCRLASEASYTPSDFPLGGMDQKQLDRLLGDLRQKKPRRAPS